MDINVKNTYDLFFHPFDGQGPTKKGFGRLAASVAIFISTIGVYHLVVGSLQKYRMKHLNEGGPAGGVFQNVHGTQALSPAEAFFQKHPQMIRPSMWKEWAEEAGIEMQAVTDEEAYESLPADIEAILESPCGIFGKRKTVEKTRMHAYIPPGLSAEDLGKILKTRFPQTLDGYHFEFPQSLAGHRKTWSNIHKALKHQPTVGGWYEITKDVIPGSRNTIYDIQKKMVQELCTENEHYVVPTTLESIACCLARFFNTQEKERLFGDDPKTYTRCQEHHKGCPVVVGGFAPAGLNVDIKFAWSPDENIGVAAMRKLS